MIAAIVESSGDAIIGQTLQGIITNWNTRAENLFGHTVPKIFGQLINSLIPPARQDEEVKILEREAVDEKYQNPYFYNWHAVKYGIYESSPSGRAMRTVFDRIECLSCNHDSRTKEEDGEWMRQYIDEPLQEKRNRLATLDPGGLKDVAHRCGHFIS
jgi:PAS domain-containing protein